MHWVGGQLKDVAKGNIIQPENPKMHNDTMPPDMMRVRYSMMLLGYEQLEPPSQPHGWDDEQTATVLITGFGYMYLWPKSQIHLGTEDQLNITSEVAQPAPPSYMMETSRWQTWRWHIILMMMKKLT